MHRDVFRSINKIYELINEIETYEKYKECLISSIDKLNKDYQKGKTPYFEYKKHIDKLLRGKSKEEWIECYDSYSLSIIKKIDYYNSLLFESIYNDSSDFSIKKQLTVMERLFGPSPFKVAVKPKPEKEKVNVPVSLKKELEDELVEIEEIRKKKPVRFWLKYLLGYVKVKKPASMEGLSKEEAEALGIAKEFGVGDKDITKSATGLTGKSPKQPVLKNYLIKLKHKIGDAAEDAALYTHDVIIKKKLSGFWSRFKYALKATFKGRVKVAEEKPIPVKKPAPKKLIAKGKLKEPSFWFKLTHLYLFAIKDKVKVRKILIKELRPLVEKKEAEKEVFAKKTTMGDKYQIGVKGILSFAVVRDFVKRLRGKERFVGRKTDYGHPLQEAGVKEPVPVGEVAAKITPTLLAKEAKRMETIIERERGAVYKPSSIGAIANLTVRKISLYLINNFPDFFKRLYNSLRLANIKILSNTYVNICVLVVIVGYILSFLFFMVYFAFKNQPFFMVFVKSLIMGLLAAVIIVAGFYSYPSSKIKDRIRNIATNLPFAANHMAAVASSGVPPGEMFRLLAESNEYGEVSIELQKVVQYINLFGYDLITAVKSVAATTPSPALKDFFDGLVSSIESGGEITVYLNEKADETMLAYRLERQKYTETISTLSDIYTGILIAAPLFFVSALSLVSMLGGTVAGMNVDTIILFGTYIIIPLLNIAFMIFLQVTQPGV